MAGRVQVVQGQKFGRLRVIEEVEKKNQQRRVLCLCECGKYRTCYLGQLRNGNSRSCGCLATELRSKAISRRNRTHGESDCRTHRIWRAMKTRCTNPAASNYEIYGGRGVKVCDRWMDSYEAFLADMGHCPGSGYSIDRIDNDGDYEPSNCRWATRRQQNRNRRDTVLLTFKGKTLCIADWAVEIGINQSTLRNRIKSYGWSAEDALTVPVGGKRGAVR